MEFLWPMRQGSFSITRGRVPSQRQGSFSIQPEVGVPLHTTRGRVPSPYSQRHSLDKVSVHTLSLSIIINPRIGSKRLWMMTRVNIKGRKSVPPKGFFDCLLEYFTGVIVLGIFSHGPYITPPTLLFIISIMFILSWSNWLSSDERNTPLWC